MMNDAAMKTATDNFVQDMHTFMRLGGFSTGQEAPVLDRGFLASMGCPSLSGQGVQTRLHKPSRGLPLGDSVETCICLVRILTARQGLPGTDTASLLVGLSRNTGVPYALADTRCTYALACAILRVIEHRRATSHFDKYVAPFICDLLNKWIIPDAPFLELPPASDVALRLFGQAWCMFAEGSGGLLCNKVARQRPPFLPGLCPAQDAMPSVPLPELGLTP